MKTNGRSKREPHPSANGNGKPTQPTCDACGHPVTATGYCQRCTIRKEPLNEGGVCRVCHMWIKPSRRELHAQGMDIHGLECPRQDLSAIMETVRGRPFDIASVKW